MILALLLTLSAALIAATPTIAAGRRGRWVTSHMCAACAGLATYASLFLLATHEVTLI